MTALASLTGHDVDDAQLVARVRAGDDRAFDTLFLRYQPRIAAWVRSRVHDHGRAEDITQEVFLSAVRRLRETDGEIAFKPWLYEIARNACIDAWRRSRHTDEVSFDEHEAVGADDHGRLAQPGLTPDSAVDVKLAFDNLRGALGGLSPSQHEILVLREFEGRSYREIGDRLGMSRASVESALFRARRQLTGEYEELVSGKRCRSIQAIVDSRGGRGLGVRDERRMTKHVAHCQPCRRYAWLAGVDLELTRRPSVAARIAALLPWPLFARRRGGGGTGQVAAPTQSAPLANAAQWSSVAASIDPAAASGLSKLVATAATVAVASLGAGAAIHERETIKDLLRSGPPAATAERSEAAARRGTAAPRISSAGAVAGAGRLASTSAVGGSAASGESTATAERQPAGGARTPKASARNAAGGDRIPSTTGLSLSPQGTADVTAPSAGGLPLAPAPAPTGSEPLRSAIAPTANGATAGGGAATAPSAPISRPQAPSAPSADDVAGQAGSMNPSAAAVSSPSPSGIAPQAPPAPAPPRVSPASATATDPATSPTAGRLAP